MKSYVLLVFSMLTLATAAAAREWPQAVSFRPGAVAGSTVGLDSSGRVTQIILLDGRTILVDHSPGGQVTAQRASSGNTVEISYDAHGRVESTLEHGTRSRIVYDDGNDVAGVVYGRDPSSF